MERRLEVQRRYTAYVLSFCVLIDLVQYGRGGGRLDQFSGASGISSADVFGENEGLSSRSLIVVTSLDVIVFQTGEKGALTFEVKYPE